MRIINLFFFTILIFCCCSTNDNKIRILKINVNNIVYLLNRSSYIYRFSLYNNVLDSFKIESNYINENNIVPFDTKNFNDKKYYNSVYEYAYKVPKFHCIKISKSLHVFFRINLHKTPYYQTNGRKTNYRNWSISVIDSNLKLIGEIPFLKDSIYDYRVFIPSENGFWLGYKQTKKDKQLKQLRLCEFKIINGI